MKEIENTPNSIPLLLLDFDEVINAVLREPMDYYSYYSWKELSGWNPEQWNSTYYKDSSMSNPYVITTNEEMIQKILSLEESGLCKLAWLTTWTQHNGQHSTLIEPKDIPQNFDENFNQRYNFITKIMKGKAMPCAGASGATLPHFNYNDNTIEQWWKLNAVENLRSQDFPIIFVDDVFHHFPKLYSTQENKDYLLKIVRVQPSIKFAKKNFYTIKKALQDFHNNN